MHCSLMDMEFLSQAGLIVSGTEFNSTTTKYIAYAYPLLVCQKEVLPLVMLT